MAGGKAVEQDVEKKTGSDQEEREPRRRHHKDSYQDKSDDRPYDRSSGRSKQKVFFKRKICKVCAKITKIDYKDADTLRRFTTERGKIIPRRITGTCAKHQRQLARAIKRARILALLPFVEKFR
ncbi:MAG: 30S ribosomal protein S18 [Spirochaetales bacterium]|nr:30S ribosomal protein S18 [Spirochaetales bacterium]